MKPQSLIALCVVVSVAAGFAGASLAGSGRDDATAGTASEAGLARVVSDLEAVREEQAVLRAAVDRLALPAPAGLPLEAIEAAVQRALERPAPLDAPLAAVKTAVAAPAETAAFDLDETLARILNEDLDQDATQELWDRIRKAGRLDEAIEILEARAKARPNDPEAQLDLAKVCIQKIFDVGGGIAAGEWAMKADKAYDSALAVDPQHWEARFSKAISLSFWPPITGKQAEAISQFRTLIEQQERTSRRPEFAQTYLMLGNLYLQQGQAEQAAKTFQAGLAQFPQNEELAAKSGS